MDNYMSLATLLFFGLSFVFLYKKFILFFGGLNNLSIGNAIKLSSSGQMSASIEDLIKTENIQNDLRILRRIAHTNNTNS